MNTIAVDSARIRSAWAGRISGCMLGKPVEVVSFQQGRAGLAGFSELKLDDVVARTVAVVQRINR